MKILPIVLCVASGSVFAAEMNHGKPIPPASVIARFEAHVARDIAKQDGVVIPRFVPQRRELPEVFVADARCVIVERYARAMGLLRESTIPLDQLTKSPQNLGFDTTAVRDVVFVNTRMDWGSTVTTVKWNCDHLGYENLPVALEWYRTQPEVAVRTKQ